MLFVCIKKDSKIYWLKNKNGLFYDYKERLYNLEDFKNIIVQEKDCLDWHELYKSTGWLPNRTDKYEDETWISPNGEFYFGHGHSYEANTICEFIYGDTNTLLNDDFLIKNGWIKTTTVLFLWNLYYDEYTKKFITQKQYDALFDWCKVHNKKFPKNIFVKE